MELHIRAEQAADIERIAEIIQAASQKYPHSNHTDHVLIDNLRREQALFLSLVAEVEGRVIGYIGFSEVEISDESMGWFCLASLAVSPERQGKGIGSALVREGLAALRRQGANGCVVLGEPSYYRRFGFLNDPELVLEEASQENFLVLPFNQTGTRGVVTYHSAFFRPC